MGKGAVLSHMTCCAIMGEWFGEYHRGSDITKYNWPLNESYKDLYSCKTTPPNGRSRKHHGMIEKLNKKRGNKLC